MKEKMIKFLSNFLIQNDWIENYTKEQARAIFTTICLMENIDADTYECDRILSYIYEEGKIIESLEFDECTDYRSFKNYMLELIV